MKDQKFFSTQDLIEEFADAIEENNFSNCIVETTSEGENEDKIEYDTDERKYSKNLEMINEHNYDDDKTLVHSGSIKASTLMIKKKTSKEVFK